MKKYGPIVAKVFKKQYYKDGKWETYKGWDIQPQATYLILKELTSKKAINAFMCNKSWTQDLK